MSEATPAPRTILERLLYSFTRAVTLIVGKLFFRLRVRGAEHVPRTGAAVLLSNHQSNMDPLLIGTASPRRLRFLARKTLFVGLLGKFIKAYGSVPIDLEGSGLSGIRATLALLKQGEPLLIFPEGTRTPDGQVQPLKPGFGTILRRGKAVTVPMGIAGAYDALPKGAKRLRFKPLAVVFGEPLPPETVSALSDEELLRVIEQRIADCWREAEQLIGR